MFEASKQNTGKGLRRGTGGQLTVLYHVGHCTILKIGWVILKTTNQAEILLTSLPTLKLNVNLHSYFVSGQV